MSLCGLIGSSAGFQDTLGTVGIIIGLIVGVSPPSLFLADHLSPYSEINGTLFFVEFLMSAAYLVLIVDIGRGIFRNPPTFKRGHIVAALILLTVGTIIVALF